MSAPSKLIKLSHARDYLRQHFAIDAGLDTMNAIPLGTSFKDADSETLDSLRPLMKRCRDNAHWEISGMIGGAKITVWKERSDGGLEPAGATWAQREFDAEGIGSDRLYFDKSEWDTLLCGIASEESQLYLARSDDRGVVIPAPIQFNDPASASQPRYDDGHRGPAVTDSYELSHCRIDLAERSEGWPTPANLPPLMVEIARSVPDDQRADWLRRQANIEEADRHISNAMRSGELPIWVAPIGEPECLVAPGAIVEVDHATIVSGVYRPPNDRGWLYGRPLFVKRNDWVNFAARIDSAKKSARKAGKFQSRTLEESDGQWLQVSKAVRILHRILKTRLAGQEPAPWIDPPADPFDAERENATHRHRRTARTSLTMRRALLSGDLAAHLVKDGRSLPLHGWAWENASAAENAFNFNWLPLNPLLEHGLQDFADWRCFVSRTEFKRWLARSEIMEIGDLPTLPVPFDQDTQPAQLSYREPPERPFVELTQALTWIAFSVSLSHDEFSFMESCRFGPFADAAWPASLRTALAKFMDQASAGKVRVRGRYVANYSDHSAVTQTDTEYLSDTQLRDFACFDSLYGGLEHGVGLTWEAQGLDRVLGGRRDGWREVQVSRENLLLAFRPKLDDTKAFFALFPATLPGIGAVMPLYEALPWLVQGKPSHDIEVWQNAAGDLMLHDPSCAIIEPRADESPPPIIEIYRHASRTLHGALREGILPAYVAPASGVPLLVPRFYWNGVNSESLHHVYRGMTPDDHGAGCPVLLSRMTFDNWRTGIGTQHSARADHVSSILSSDPGRPNKRDEAIVLHSERVLDGSALPGKNAEAKAIEAILKRRHANDRGYEYKWASIARALRDYRDG